MMGVVDQLKKCEKARLPYNRDDSPKAIKEFLENCTSPPSVHVSPNYVRNQRLKEQIEEEKENQSKDDKEKQQASSKSEPPCPSIFSSETGSVSDEPLKPTCRPIVSTEYNQSMLAIQKYEEELRIRARLAHQEKKRLFAETKLRHEKEAELRLLEHEQQANFDGQQKIQNIEVTYQSQTTEILKQHQKLKETHEQRKMEHTARIKEVELARERIKQEELQQKEQKKKELLDKIDKCIGDLNTLNAKVQSKYTDCKYQEYISEGGKKSLAFIQSRIAAAENVKQELMQNGEATVRLFDKCRDLMEQTGNAYEFVCKELENAEKAGKKAKEEAEKQANLQKEQQATVTSQPAESPTQTNTTVSKILDVNELAKEEGATLCVYPDSFKKYTALLDGQKKVESAIQVLSSTSELKKLKFDIQKAVNTPINALSAVSGEHLRDKLKRLLSLLSGQVVEVGNKRISLKQHPQATDFCQHLIAKMIVKKGAEQVSSKFESAFPIAMVTVGLWKEQPAMGNLLLAQFYQACPYLVPYYLPKQEGQSNEDYFKSRGYCYEEYGTIESQEKFLKRMSGIMRLYFSILVSEPPRGDHPHGMNHAWTWFSQVLNLEPEPDITATMIYDFLQVVGKSLYKTYFKSFHKLLHVLTKEIVPKLEKVSSAAGSGSLSRLKILLESSLRNQGQYSEPEGYLDRNFWMS